MKIYDYRGFPNPARVRIAVAEKGLTEKVEFISVNVPEGEHRQAAFRAKNPAAQVPVLELDDGACIAECSLITEYLDHLVCGPTLTGRTGKDRAMIRMMDRRADAGLLEALTTYFHHATAGLGPDLESYQNKEWGEKGRERALAGMRYLNDVLARQPYLAGDHFSVADITGFVGLAFADFAKVDIPAECDHLKAWRTRVARRPSIAHA